MNSTLPLLCQALLKAQAAYGDAVIRDQEAALLQLQNRPDWLERCMQALAMVMPKAVFWKQLCALQRVIS